MTPEFFHEPVLLKEVVDLLALKSNQNVVDCTFGGGGHAAAILEKTAPAGKLIGIDWNAAAIKNSQELMKKYPGRIIIAKDNFVNLKTIVEDSGLKIDSVLADLGVSTYELKNELGFDVGTLDLRMDPSDENGLTAEKILNKWSQARLEKIFQEFGEERLAKVIAREVVAYRQNKSFEQGKELEDIVKNIYQRFYHRPSRINPVTKIWQALRITVNNELENLTDLLPQALEIIPSGGRIAVIAFHSLEDRIVKNFFRDESKDCLCPSSVPVCVCKHKKILKLITKKPVVPSDAEIMQNPASRSAKLRVIEKI